MSHTISAYQMSVNPAAELSLTYSVVAQMSADSQMTTALMYRPPLIG